MDRKSGGGSRKKKVTGSASGDGVFRRGSGANTGVKGPVGNKTGYSDRRLGAGGTPGSSQQQPGSFSGGQQPGGGFLGVPNQGSGGTRPSSGGLRPPGGRPSGVPGGCGLSIGKILILIVILVIGYFLLRSCTGMLSEAPEDLLPQNYGSETSDLMAVTGDPANNDISPMTGITGKAANLLFAALFWCAWKDLNPRLTE